MHDVSAGGLVILAAVSMLAGALNAVAGGGTLLTFPTLVAIGLPPVSANVTNTVALVPGYAGGIAGYRRELDDQSTNVRRLVPVAALGALIGATILLVTSAKVFDVIVPVLVAGASILLLVQPVLQRRLRATHPVTGEPIDGGHRIAAMVSVFVASIYGGYFGGVLGVVLLAALGITMLESLQRLNALKSVLQFVCNGVAVVVFALFGPVQWWFVLVMAPMTLLGGWVGSRNARRLHPSVLRAVVGVFGLGCAVVLALRLR
ncbi:MAG: sulfite exporter TauE/SafE family protein [Acidimicrobiia bacterium]